MKSVGRWLRGRREILGLTREELIGKTGLSLATIARAETDQGGKSRSTIVALAKALRLNDDEAEALADWAADRIGFDEFLARYNGTGPSGSRYGASAAAPGFALASAGGGTPIVGEVTAGGMVESMVFDSGDQPERLPIVYPEMDRVYALRIRGDSMAPEYRPGEFLICQDVTRDMLFDGQDAVIQLDGSEGGVSTFKRVYWMGEGRVRLVALNAAYPPVECNISSIVRVGKVVGVYRPVPQHMRRLR